MYNRFARPPVWHRGGCGDSTGSSRCFGVSGYCSRDIEVGPDVHGRPSVGVGIVIFFYQRAEKDSVMFGAGATTSNLCPPGMMCKLDCPWLSPYLFVCLGGWPVGIREQPDLANIRGFC